MALARFEISSPAGLLWTPDWDAAHRSASHLSSAYESGAEVWVYDTHAAGPFGQCVGAYVRGFNQPALVQQANLELDAWESDEDIPPNAGSAS